MFHMSTPLCKEFQLLPNPQSRFGQFSCLPFLWPHPSAPPLPGHLGLIEVSWFWAQTEQLTGVEEFPKGPQPGKISQFEVRQPIGWLCDWDKVLFTQPFNSPFRPLHLLSERFNISPSAGFYLPGFTWTTLLKADVSHEAMWVYFPKPSRFVLLEMCLKCFNGSTLTLCAVIKLVLFSVAALYYLHGIIAFDLLSLCMCVRDRWKYYLVGVDVLLPMVVGVQYNLYWYSQPFRY